MPTTLASVRDLLLPGLHVISKEIGRELDMAVVFTEDRLSIRDVKGEVLSLPADYIASGAYKTNFGRDLRAALKRGKSHGA